MIVSFALSLLCSVALYAGTIDIHTHISSDAKPGDDWSYESLLKSMAAGGVERAVVLSLGYARKDKTATRAENDWVAGLQKKDPRIIGFCGVPFTADWAVSEIIRCKQIGLRGLKLHPQNIMADLRIDANFVRFKIMLDVAVTQGLPVLIDSTWLDSSVTIKVLRVAMEIPDLKLICAHAFFTDFRDLFTIRKLYDSYDIPKNIYVDVSATLDFYKGHPEQPLLEWHLRKFGLDRVFFGTDYPIVKHTAMLEALETYGFTLEEKKLMMEKNFKDVLGW